MIQFLAVNHSAAWKRYARTLDRLYLNTAKYSDMFFKLFSMAIAHCCMLASGLIRKQVELFPSQIQGESVKLVDSQNGTK